MTIPKTKASAAVIPAPDYASFVNGFYQAEIDISDFLSTYGGKITEFKKHAVGGTLGELLIDPASIADDSLDPHFTSAPDDYRAGYRLGQMATILSAKTFGKSRRRRQDDDATA